MRKKLPIKTIIIITLFSIFILSFARQSVTIKKINSDIAKKTQQLQELEDQNKKMQAELDAAQSNYDYLEKLARERLGLIIDGEQVVIPLKPQE